MSFGKAYSPQKSAVDEAALYAAARGVLLVHAAGNDAKDLGDGNNFPTDRTLSGETVSTWLEVGASTADPDALAATFSNVGDDEVDLFAPGAEVTSLAPGGEIQVADGTSFAAPVVSGVAALLFAYFPDLTAEDVREILLASATPLAEAMTPAPGSGEAVPFGSLSVTGGVVNAAEAVRLAMERSGS
jgi:subtilisin family serine protease